MNTQSGKPLEAIHGLLSPHTTKEPLYPGLRRRWLRLLAFFEARRRQRRAAAELATLSDHMLADIGVARDDLPELQRRPHDMARIR